jgi:hypothetical protein
MAFPDILSFIPAIGDSLSWVTQEAIQFIARFGVEITSLQSKVLLLLILGGLIYIFLSVITFAKKMLKWGLIILAIFLAVSVAISIFI